MINTFKDISSLRKNELYAAVRGMMLENLLQQLLDLKSSKGAENINLTQLRERVAAYIQTIFGDKQRQLEFCDFANRDEGEDLAKKMDLLQEKARLIETQVFDYHGDAEYTSTN